MKNKSITSRDVDFAAWYTDVVKAAKLASYSNVKGCVVIEPNGYAIWEQMQKTLDRMFKETGHQNICMPMLIPENLMRKEGELINGFAPEVAWVTMGGQKTLEERMCIRPTSETLFSDYYSTKVKSYRDLPIKYNQWCNVLRWEKETRPFLRSREILWQEGHTMHASEEEAREETLKMLNVYKDIQENYLALPVLTGKKTEKEKFAGAVETYTLEAMMYDGVALQNGTSHYFGQGFAKAFDIQFLNKDNKLETPYQTSWGVSTRMIGGLIMTHSDDNGLVLPPMVAPTKVAIIPIGDVNEVVDRVTEELKANEITFIVDDSDKSPGFKFAEAEVKGYPIRLEVGKRDLDNGFVTLVRRDTLEKIQVSVDEVLDKVKFLLVDIQANLFNRAKERRDSMIHTAENYDEFKDIAANKPGFIISKWCGNVDCENKIKEDTTFKSRCIIDEEKSGKCVCCGEDANYKLYWGKQY